jgi:anti-anti-sigma regulatory factor
VLTLDVATPSDSVVTVIAHGDIDIDTSPRLHDCLRQHLRPGGCLVLDTTAVTYCDLRAPLSWSVPRQPPARWAPRSQS